MSASIAPRPVDRRSGSRAGVRASRRLVAAQLAVLCDICGGRFEGGEVLVVGGTCCSLECAQSARDRTPAGNYFG